MFSLRYQTHCLVSLPTAAEQSTRKFLEDDVLRATQSNLYFSFASALTTSKEGTDLLDGSGVVSGALSAKIIRHNDEGCDGQILEDVQLNLPLENFILSQEREGSEYPPNEFFLGDLIRYTLTSLSAITSKGEDQNKKARFHSTMELLGLLNTVGAQKQEVVGSIIRVAAFHLIVYDATGCCQMSIRRRDERDKEATQTGLKLLASSMKQTKSLRSIPVELKLLRGAPRPFCDGCIDVMVQQKARTGEAQSIQNLPLSELKRIQSYFDALNERRSEESSAQMYFACAGCPNRFYCSVHSRNHHCSSRDGCKWVWSHHPRVLGFPIKLSHIVPLQAEVSDFHFILKRKFVEFSERPFLCEARQLNGEVRISCLSFGEVWRSSVKLAVRIRRTVVELRSSNESATFAVLRLPDEPIFFIADLACALAGVPSIPLSPSQQHLPENFPTADKILLELVCQEEKQHSGNHQTKITGGCTTCCPSFDKMVISLETLSAEVDTLTEDEKYLWNMLGKSEKHHHRESALFGLFPTSGSSGEPRYAQYSRETWLRRLLANQPSRWTSRRRGDTPEEEDVELGGDTRRSHHENLSLQVTVQFAPMTHFSARSACWDAVFNGGTRVFANPHKLDLFQVIKMVEPTGVFLVPMLWEQLYSRSHQKMDDQAASLEALFGRRCFAVSSGSVPLPPIILTWITQELLPTASPGQISFVNGYGSTEVGASISINGTISPGVDIKIDEKDNQIWVKTDNMFEGYYKGRSADRTGNRPSLPSILIEGEGEQQMVVEEEEEEQPAGYLKTGDCGYFDSEGKLQLTGRVGGTVKLSNGLYCRCEVVEMVCVGKFGITQAFATIAPESRAFLLLFVVLKSLDPQRHPHNVLQAELQQHLIGHSSLQPHEIPVMIKVLGVDANSSETTATKLTVSEFTVQNGLLTASMKLKRKALTNALMEESQLMEKHFKELVARNSGEALAQSFSDLGLGQVSSLEISLLASKLAKSLPGDRLPVHVLTQTLLRLGQASVVKEDGRTQEPAALRVVATSSPSSADLLAKDIKDFGIADMMVAPFLDGDDTERQLEIPRSMGELNDGLHRGNRLDGILLTGSTGHVGSGILFELLSSSSSTHQFHEESLRIFCPVRCSTIEEGLKRLLDRQLQLLGASDLRGNLEERLEQFVTVIPLCESSAPYYLSSDYPIASKVHRVLHCAASTDMLANYAQLRETNVLWSMALAERYGIEKMSFISTVNARAAFNRFTGLCVRAKTVKSNTPKTALGIAKFLLGGESGQDQLAGYGVTKAVVELALLSKKNKCGAELIRLPFIWCEESTGVGNIGDSLFRLVAASLANLKVMNTNSFVSEAKKSSGGFPLVGLNDTCRAILGTLARCEIRAKDLFSSTISSQTATLCCVSPTQFLPYDQLSLSMVDWIENHSAEEREQQVLVDYAAWYGDVFLCSGVNQSETSNRHHSLALLPIAHLYHPDKGPYFIQEGRSDSSNILPLCHSDLITKYVLWVGSHVVRN